MKILLTGYTGFLGRHLARSLKAEGFFIRVLFNHSTVPRRDFLAEADELLWGSIHDPNTVKKALNNIDWVVHSAWKFSSQTIQRPTLNEKATEQLFKESIANGIKGFVFISSVAVYGMSSRKKHIINESSNLDSGKNLAYIYPSEKIKSESILRSFESRGTKLVIFRPGPIFDENKSPIKKIIWFAGIPFAIGLGNGRNNMPYIHAHDVANAITKCIKMERGNAIFNVTPTNCMRHKDWYRAWGKAHNLKIKPVFIRRSVIYLVASLVGLLKKLIGKSGKVDVSYAIASATRNLLYSNEHLKKQLNWTPEKTDKYLL